VLRLPATGRPSEAGLLAAAALTSEHVQE